LLVVVQIDTAGKEGGNWVI